METIKDQIVEEVYDISVGPELDRVVAETILDWKNKWCPEFSSDITAMWRLREYLCNNYIVIMSNGDGDSADVQLLPFNGMTHNSAFGSAAMGEMPVALCRAALIAERLWQTRPDNDKWPRKIEEVV